MIDLNLLNKAIILTKQGLLGEAEKLYLQLLEQDSNNEFVLSAFGLFYVQQRNFDKASYYLKKACEIKESLGTLSALGFAEFEKNDFASAAEILERSLSFGDSEAVYNKLILSLFHIKNYPKAIEYSQKMFELYPQNSDAVANMVKAYTQTGKLLEAEKMCVEYLKEHNDSASLWFHLGFLKELIYSDDKQAGECYKIALELGNKEAYYNLAVSYQKRGDYENAEKYYNNMLEEFPNDIDTMTSLGMCKLTQKKFKEGYDLFFKRDKSLYADKMKSPWLQGMDFEKNVVVICDQGFGDHIQFSRYLPLLKEKVENLYVATRKPLKTLFEKNYAGINFIDYEEIDPQMQSILITDLAYALGVDFGHICGDEYLDVVATTDIKSDKLKVGLCWEAGSAGIRTMINRTINVRLLEPILNLDNVQLYSFQVTDTFNGNERYPQMINLAKDFKTFEDTAKAMKAMDVIISVDTSVAHLAGALGIKTFLMLPYASDWRWFSDTQTTPWYKSVEIFKQIDSISWEKPIGDIICRLKEYSL